MKALQINQSERAANAGWGFCVVVDDGSLDAAAEGIRPSNAEGPPMCEEGGCTTRHQDSKWLARSMDVWSPSAERVLMLLAGWRPNRGSTSPLPWNNRNA